MTATPLVRVSWGELIDRITILEIKLARFNEAGALANVRKQFGEIGPLAAEPLRQEEIARLKQDLKAINESLWEIEERLRRKEALASFDAEFIELARAVYKRNDERAGVKRRIDELLSSEAPEEKCYTTTHPN